MSGMRGLWLTLFVLCGIPGASHAVPGKPKGRAPVEKAAPPATPPSESSPPAVVDPRVQAIHHMHEAAQKAIADGQLATAKELYAQARLMDPDRPFTYYWLGHLAFLQHDCTAAVLDLRAYLDKRHVNLDGSPGLREANQNDFVAMAHIEKCDGRGGIEIHSDPEGAAVRIDDEKAPPAGVTPLVRRYLTTGAHRLFIIKQDYQSTSVTVIVKPGDVTGQTVTLAPTGFAILPPSKIPKPVTPRPTKARPEKPIAAPGPDADEDDLPLFHPPPPPEPPLPAPKLVMPPPPPVDPSEPPKWYKKGWVWGVITASAVVVGAGVVTGTYLGTRDPYGGSDYKWMWP